jgi:hypothetical protein
LQRHACLLEIARVKAVDAVGRLFLVGITGKVYVVDMANGLDFGIRAWQMASLIKDCNLSIQVLHCIKLLKM